MRRLSTRRVAQCEEPEPKQDKVGTSAWHGVSCIHVERHPLGGVPLPRQDKDGGIHIKREKVRINLMRLDWN